MSQKTFTIIAHCRHAVRAASSVRAGMIFGKDKRLTVQSKLSKDTRARQQGRGALHYSAAISKSLATNGPALSNFADCPEEPIVVSQFLPKSLFWEDSRT